MIVPVVEDNATVADLGTEPEGFWAPIHEQVDAWVTAYEDGGESD